MTRDEIIRMAREAGAHELFRLDGAQDSGIGLTGNESIIRFAEMVAEAERVTRIAAQCEADDLKERLARSGVEQRRAVRAERVWIDFTDLNSLAERGAAHEAFITSYGTDKAAEFVSADEMTRLIAQAVAAEREACALVCDAQAETHELLSNTQAAKGCDDCANAIRARGSNVP